MKSRKTRTLVALGLAAISGFSLMMVYAAEKDIKLDPTNAKQTIPTIHFRSNISNSGQYVELKNTGKMVRIDTRGYNFVISKRDAGNLNSAAGSNSAVLGGIKNHIDGNGSTHSTIIGGESNQINSSAYGTIGGGKSNSVDGGIYGTVAGGEENKSLKDYATVVGGKSNEAKGQYAVALGDTSKANGSNSVAMGKKATVNGASSFLWNDGTSANTVSSDNVFAVVGGSGMVVNTNKAHRFAQLTIGGSLIINSKNSDASGCNPTTKGVVKVVAGSHSQACFCSCNGTKRSSLYGGGDCSSKCDKAIVPKCDNSKLIKDCTSQPYSYSGHCIVGDVAEGKGAYMVDKNGEVHWTCQTNDGKTDSCAAAPTNTIGTCTEPDPEGQCSGGYDTDKAEFVEGSDTGFSGIKDAVLYNRRSNVPAGAKCAWYCKEGYYKQGDICAPLKGCDEYDDSGYHVPYLAHGETRTITNNAGTCTRVASCDNGTPSLGAETCYSCTGNYPDGVTTSSVAPTSNKKWTCATNLTQACTYTCPAGQKCNEAGDGCINKDYGECDLTKPYGCKKTSDVVSKVDTTSSTEWQWYCKGVDDTGNGKYCHVDCEDLGREGTLKWSSLHNGSCIPACTPTKQCSDYGYSTGNADGCYAIKHVDDGCGGDLTCFAIGCTAAIGTSGYTCVKADNVSTACADAGGLKDEKQIDNDNYRCIACNGLPDEPECGGANGTNRDSAPSSAEEKCKNGSSSIITPSNIGWSWTCSKNGKTTPPCQAWKDPKCGSASGTTVPDMPTGTAACDPGSVKNGGGLNAAGTKYEWICVNGVRQVDCSAIKQQLTQPTIHIACHITKEKDSYAPSGCGGPAWESTTYSVSGGVAPFQINIIEEMSHKELDDGLLSPSCFYEDIVSDDFDYTILPGESVAKLGAHVKDETTWENGKGYSKYYIHNSHRLIAPECGEGCSIVIDPCTESVVEVGTPLCQGNYPDGVTTSSVTPTSNKKWTCATNLTQACTYTCPAGQKCNEAGDGCINKDYGECDLTKPYGCKKTSDVVSKVDTMNSTEWQWYCKGADDTGNGTYCHVDCEDLGREGTLNWSSLHNGNCVKEEPMACCETMPANASPLYVDEDVDDLSELNSKALCTPIQEETTEETNYNQDGPGPDGCGIQTRHGNSWSRGGDGCGTTRYCCEHEFYDAQGRQGFQRECGSSVTAMCYGGTSSYKTIWGFQCEKGYHLEGCDCVLDKTPPIEIEVTCNTQYYQSTDFVGGWVDGCAQTMWKSTSYTANKSLPTDLYIQQVKYGYGVSDRDPNSCIFCHHPGHSYVTTYKIPMNSNTSTLESLNEWTSTITWKDKNSGGIGFDMEMMNGVSSLSLNKVVGDTVPGDISSPTYSLIYTDASGQEYNIKLKDCNNKHESWLNTNPRIDSTGICTRSSGGGGDSLTSCSCGSNGDCVAGTNGKGCFKQTNPDGSYYCLEEGGAKTTTCRPGGSSGGGSSSTDSYTLEYRLSNESIVVNSVKGSSIVNSIPDIIGLVTYNSKGTSRITKIVYENNSYAGGNVSSPLSFGLGGGGWNYGWLDFASPDACDRGSYVAGSVSPDENQSSTPAVLSYTNAKCTIGGNVYEMKNCKIPWAYCVSSNTGR